MADRIRIGGKTFVEETGAGDVNVTSDSLDTERQSVSDPSGNVQLEFEGLGDSNEVLDVDNINQDGFLDTGVIINKKDDINGTVRLILGEDVYLGMQAPDPAQGGSVATSEMLKSSGSQTILENDFEGKATVLENKKGGGIRFRTDDGTGTEINRMSVYGDIDTNGGEVVIENNTDIFRVSPSNQTVFESDIFINEQRIKAIKTYSNAVPGDLAFKEFAFDDNRGGTGNFAALKKDASGTVHYWDADGTL